MSPEQAAGDLEQLGAASDVYSLGATLYCLLTGAPPFVGDAVDVIPHVRRGDFRPPRVVDPAIDRALEAVCLKAMALRPEDRYGSPRALAEDVERWLADEPLSAWREPWSRRLARWQARHRAGVMAAGAAVLVALAGLGIVLAVQARANDHLLRANESLAAANARVMTANSELEAANGRERQRFDLATEAIRRYHTGVSEDFLLRQDQFKELRDRLLRDAVAFYQKLEGLLVGQTDTRSRRALGRAYEEVGELTDKVGSVPEALAMHRKALEVRRALAREAAADPDVQADVGRSLIAIGYLQGKMGHYQEALASLQEARSVLGVSTRSGRDRGAILREIARSDYWTGVFYRRVGQTQPAMRALDEATAIVARLAAAHPGSVDDQRLLSWCENDTGVTRYEQGSTAEALTAFERSRRIKQKIVAEHPGVAEYRRDLASSHHNLGFVLRETGRPIEAVAAHEASLAILESLVAAYPAVTLLQSDLANGLNDAGDALRLVGRMAEARASYERALAILDGLVQANPTVTGDQSRLLQGIRLQGIRGLGATQRAAGRDAEAMASWRRATAEGRRLRPSDGESLYYLACCHALLGGAAAAPAELDRAMAVLRQAVAAGYRSLDCMRRDPDLDPLRPRPDFGALLLDLAFPAEPFARGE
jgi:serine/threonine-protein kinase